MTDQEYRKLTEDMFNFRVTHDMSQTDMAKACHVSLQTINSVENGKQKPGKMTRAKIGRVIYADVKGEEVNEPAGAEA